MSQIDDKHQQLKSAGLDLGSPKTAESDAGYGGRVRQFEHGNIYYHPSTGAHEVHGGILSLYLAHGGQAVNPQSGFRELGFPVSDEIQAFGAPMSQFEFGAIYWIPGTRGCVMFGAIWEIFKQSALGMPICGNTPFNGGEVAYFERGVIFNAPPAAQAPELLVGYLDPPLMGNPKLVDPANEEDRRFRTMARWRSVSRKQYDALTTWKPSIFADIWNERLALSPVGEVVSGWPRDPLSPVPDIRGSLPDIRNHVSAVPLGVTQVTISDQTAYYLDLEAVLEAFPGSVPDLQDRTLYDLQLKLPNGTPYSLSPHCVYVKKDWDNFGLLHITDLHVNRRNNLFAGKLNALGFSEAAVQYSNFQQCLRDFIQYANKLHKLGLADAVAATGDLIDYVAEDGDKDTDNFQRLRQILLGQPFDFGDPAGEELQIPIFMTFGNHDYRLHPYDLTFDVTIPEHESVESNYASHNLTEQEAIAVQGGRIPKYGVTDLDGMMRMIVYAPNEAGNPYGFFEKYMSKERSYIVRLGKHRLVMLDTKFDDGVPGDANAALLINYLAEDKLGGDNYGMTVPQATRNLMNGSVASVGLSEAELGILKNAVFEAGSDGVVIVGMHCPVLSHAGHDYAYFMRETLHPAADPALTDDFVRRHKLNGASWFRNGTPYFKVGDTSDGLDADTIANGDKEFLEICAGVGQSRPVDLVLYGHVHNRVEYSARWNPSASRMEYYMDFYTETPPVYYHSVNGHRIEQPAVLEEGAPLMIRVDGEPGSQVTLAVTTRQPAEGSGVKPTTFGMLHTPRYADPLELSADPKTWWQKHRPLLAQTGALGPMDPRQRFGTFYKATPPLDDIRPIMEFNSIPNVGHDHNLEGLPMQIPDALFQGFRLVQIQNGVIQRMRYIVLRDLRALNFSMPWERDWNHIRDEINRNVNRRVVP